MINLARIIIFLISLSLSLYSLFVATVTFRDLNFTLTITHLSKAIIIGYGIILVLIAPSGLWGIIGSILNNPELTIRYIRDHWFALIIISIIDIVKTIFPFINKDQVINDCLGPATMNDAADTAITNCQNDFDFNQRASWIIFGGQEVILVVLGIIAWRCQRNIGVKPGIGNNKTEKKDKKSKKSMKPSNDDNTIDQDSDLSSVIVQPSLSYINVKDNDNLDTSNFNNNDNDNNNNNNNNNNDNDNENENSNSDDNVINNNGINQEAARNYNSQNSTQIYQDLNSVSNIYPNSPNPTPNFYPNNPNPPPASLHQNRQLNTSDRQLLPPKRYNTLSLTSHNQNPYLPINSSRIQQVPLFQQQQKNYQKYTTYQQITAATTNGNGNGNGNGNNNIPIPNFAQQPLIQYQQPQLQSQYSHHQQQQYQQLQQHNYIPNHNDSQNGHVHTHRRSKSHPQLRPLPKPPGADESQIPQIPQIPIIPNSSSIIPIQPLSTPIRQQQLFQQFPDHQQRPIINDSRYVSQTPKRSSTNSRLHQPLPYQSLRSNSLPSAHKPKELLEQELSVAPPVPSISGSSGDNNDHSIPDSLIPGGNRSSVARKKIVAKSDNNNINNSNNNNNSLKKYVPPALSSLENGSKTALERFIHTYGNVTPESPSFRYSDVQPLPKPKSNDGENVTDKNNYNNKNSNINSINDSDNAKNVNRLRPKSAHSVKGEASPKFNVPSVYGGIPNGYYNNYYDNNLNNNNINNNINNSSSNSNNNNSHLQDKQFIPQSSYYYK